MDARHSKKALLGLGIGLPLFLGGWTVIFLAIRGMLGGVAAGGMPWVIAIAMIIVSVPFYLWGCAQLANAKGYSTAIVLTCILGWLFPLVILLVLPDKNTHHRRRW